MRRSGDSPGSCTTSTSRSWAGIFPPRLRGCADPDGGGIDPEIVDAVKMHNEAVCGVARSTEFQHALAAGETVTGLVVATALVYPDKKIAGVRVKSITKRMKERAFAASVNRETIRECEKIGLPLDEFVGISLSAMQGIAGRLGLPGIYCATEIRIPGKCALEFFSGHPTTLAKISGSADRPASYPPPDADRSSFGFLASPG